MWYQARDKQKKNQGTSHWKGSLRHAMFKVLSITHIAKSSDTMCICMSVMSVCVGSFFISSIFFLSFVKNSLRFWKLFPSPSPEWWLWRIRCMETASCRSWRVRDVTSSRATTRGETTRGDSWRPATGTALGVLVQDCIEFCVHHLNTTQWTFSERSEFLKGGKERYMDKTWQNHTCFILLPQSWKVWELSSRHMGIWWPVPLSAWWLLMALWQSRMAMVPNGLHWTSFPKGALRLGSCLACHCSLSLSHCVNPSQACHKHVIFVIMVSSWCHVAYSNYPIAIVDDASTHLTCLSTCYTVLPVHDTCPTSCPLRWNAPDICPTVPPTDLDGPGWTWMDLEPVTVFTPAWKDLWSAWQSERPSLTERNL